MAPIFVVVLEVRTHKPDKMIPVKHDHMIEQFSSTTANPSLRDTILPRTAVSGAAWLDTHCLDESHQLGTEDRVVVEYEVVPRRVKGKRLTQLLNHLCRRRIRGRVEM